jgi:hypothetical protein
VLIVIVVLLVLLLGGGGAYYGPRAGWEYPQYSLGGVLLVILVLYLLFGRGRL